MGFWKIIVGLIQRKLLLFPLLGVAITLGIVGYFLTPLKYISSTTMVLVTPAFGGSLSLDPSRPTDLTNPLLNFNDNLKTASTILIYEMNSREVAAELGVLNGPTKITVDDGRTNPNLILNNGPFVYIVGEATSRTEAKDVVIRAQKRMRQELIDRQKALNAPIETYVTLADVVAPTVPEVSRADRLKVGGAAFVLSFLMGLSAAYAWQRLREERPRRDMAERLFQGQEHESHGSLGWDPVGSSDSRVKESTADRQMTSTDSHLPDVGNPLAIDQLDRASSTPVTVILRSAEDEEINPDEQVAGEEAGAGTAHRNDYGEMLAEAHLPADAPSAGQADQSAEPKFAAYPEEEANTVMHWNLYFVDNQPTDREHPVPSSSNDELQMAWDWDLDDLHSQRIS